MPGKLSGIKDMMAIGRPIIVSDDISVTYFVNYGNGKIFSRSNIDDLAEKMEEYVTNPESIIHDGNLSLKYVKENLSWVQIAKTSINIYQHQWK